MRTHTNAAGDHWVHFFATKGNGLAFLANALSDVQGAALASYLMMLVGAGMIWRLAGRAAHVAPAIGLIGACLLLEYYGGQGAYAKPHLIRNVFLLYIILSGVRALAFHDRGASINRASRLAVVTAILVLSPLALVILLPILFVEAALLAVARGASEVRRALVAPVWALGVTALVCAYNYFEVGLPELHNMPSVVGRFVNIERFSRWIDPGLALKEFGDSEGVYFIPPHMVKELVDEAEITHIHDEWTKKKFDEGKYKSTEIYGRPSDPALIREYEEYLKQKLGTQAYGEYQKRQERMRQGGPQRKQ